MAIPTDPEGKKDLAKTIGKRLAASRRAAGLSQAQAAVALRHKGITQVSLAEDGQRMPPLLDLVKYADLYCVPVDFLLGRINDPIAEAGEHSQGLMVRTVAHSITSVFDKFAAAVSGHVSVSLMGQRGDRRDLVEIIAYAEELEVAMARLRGLNPSFDEELRGSARIVELSRKISDMGRRVDARTKKERHQYEMIDKALELQAVEGRMEQFVLAFAPGPQQQLELASP